jgi:hypothetical protein
MELKSERALKTPAGSCDASAPSACRAPFRLSQTNNLNTAGGVTVRIALASDLQGKSLVYCKLNLKQNNLND